MQGFSDYDGPDVEFSCNDVPWSLARVAVKLFFVPIISAIDILRFWTLALIDHW